jgi:hypothetical protein
MTWDEIEVPKEIRPFMLDEAEDTKLGQKKAQTNNTDTATFT